MPHPFFKFRLIYVWVKAVTGRIVHEEIIGVVLQEEEDKIRYILHNQMAFFRLIGDDDPSRGKIEGFFDSLVNYKSASTGIASDEFRAVVRQSDKKFMQGATVIIRFDKWRSGQTDIMVKTLLDYDVNMKEAKSV
jgi:hypothetical protein